MSLKWKMEYGYRDIKYFNVIEFVYGVCIGNEVKKWIFNECTCGVHKGTVSLIENVNFISDQFSNCEKTK